MMSFPKAKRFTDHYSAGPGPNAYDITSLSSEKSVAASTPRTRFPEPLGRMDSQLRPLPSVVPRLLVTGPKTPRKDGARPNTPRKDGRWSTSTTPRKEGGLVTTPRKDQRRATPRKMTPRKAPGNATPPAIRELRRDSKIITTPKREEFKIKFGDVKKKVEPNQVEKIEKVDEVGDIGAKSKSGLRNEGSGEDKGERGTVCNLCRNQVADDVYQERSGGKLQRETADKGTDMVEELPTLDLDTNNERQSVLREELEEVKKISRALEQKERELEAKEAQLSQRESDMAQSRQSIKNIRSIIDEKQILLRKLADMENELQGEKVLRMEAESRKEEVEHGALSLNLELETSQREKSELVDQCHTLGSRLELMVEEVKMSRDIEERLSAELEKVKRVTQTGCHQIVGSSPQEKVNVAALLKQCPSPQFQQLKARKEELTIEVSGEAGRIRGEALDFLRINIDDETPKSGSRMDFGEKKVYFQKKIEAEISSPSLRERK